MRGAGSGFTSTGGDVTTTDSGSNTGIDFISGIMTGKDFIIGNDLRIGMGGLRINASRGAQPAAVATKSIMDNALAQ